MKLHLKEIIPPMLITLLILVVLEIVSTTVLPILGMYRYRLPFNILIILFLGFKLESSIIALLILIVQYFHSFFSIESWAMGTFAGIVTCMIISYLRDIIHFTSAMVAILITQLFQILWFIIVSCLIYVKVGSWDYILDKLARFSVESIIISLLAPFFFSVLDRIWKVDRHGRLEDEI